VLDQQHEEREGDHDADCNNHQLCRAIEVGKGNFADLGIRAGLDGPSRAEAPGRLEMLYRSALFIEFGCNSIHEITELNQ
jgi:hypothetical protein